ncbi:hypothetical protein GGX14DRAFT_669242 [Mycena pura]|uniref:DUF6533 domain-containing protein n=1 Tax=Mycena pura TaxID=153505 RepID=A0AAD6YK48_9AGAR|nr:hypothetical protein GGX14DRAFT_669242 [Mycena pura]
MSTSALQMAAYLRVSAYAIAFFDYLQTLPAEYRLYAQQKGIFQLSTACVLLFLVRYLGLAAMIFGNTGFFYHRFTEESCRHYYWLAPIFKLLLYLVSQAILALRTYAVSRKSPIVLKVLVVLYIMAAVMEAISSFWKRIRNAPGVHLASLYYVGGLMFDVVTMTISSAYLWKFSRTNRSTRSLLVKLMLKDGLMYFVALSAMNVVNIIFYNNPNTAVQSSAGPLGFAATMIFSSRFILNLSEHVRDGISGEQSTSRTPAPHHASHHPAFRTANQLASEDGPDGGLVVKVMKNVITMSDMGRDHADEVKSHNDAWDGRTAAV